MSADKVGTHFMTPPQPRVEADTRYVPAGVITIGVEHRALTAAELRQFYLDLSPKFAANAAAVDPTLDLDGVSLHVVDAASGHEYVRFDCFDNDPHYHYIRPRPDDEDDGLDNHVIWYDTAALGPILPWALGQLRTRLPDMLVEAEAPHLAAALDTDLVNAAADEVERIAHEVLGGRAPVDR